MYFKYGEEEIEYLKSRDEKLSKVIEKIGHINRKVDKDLFSALVHHIVGQQISTKAQETIWQRINNELKVINPESIQKAGIDKLQSLGVSSRKAEYIMDFANKVKSGEFDIGSVSEKSDDDAIAELVKLKGVGVWTAEMLLLFCLGRKNVLSFDDLGIQRGLKILYHHRKITKTLFAKYRRRFSPYCSVASLYLWEVSKYENSLCL